MKRKVEKLVLAVTGIVTMLLSSGAYFKWVSL